MNLSIKQKQIHIENRLLVARVGWGGKEWEFGVSRYKLLFIKWINTRLYSNYIRNPMINHNGKE